jgi:anti-sigma-K factor RskA
MTSEPCREWRGEIAALSLAEPGDPASIRTQAHVDGCADCRAALAELRRVTALLAHADPDRAGEANEPPPDLAARILVEVRDERQRRKANRRRRAVLTFAAAAAALVLIALTVVSRGDDDPRLHEFTAVEAGATGRYALEANDQGTAVRLEHQGLDVDEIYWLWLTDDSGRRVSAGTFRGSTGEASLDLQSALPYDGAVRIWVTDEQDAVVFDAEVPAR